MDAVDSYKGVVIFKKNHAPATVIEKNNKNNGQ
jgi:hypothetical protein